MIRIMMTILNPSLAGIYCAASWVLMVIVGLCRALGSQDPMFIPAFQFENRKLRNFVIIVNILWFAALILYIGSLYPGYPLITQAAACSRIALPQILIMLCIQPAITLIMAFFMFWSALKKWWPNR